MSEKVAAERTTKWCAIDWPTVAIATAIYIGWIVATLWHAQVPAPLLGLIGGWLVAWHGSLQHETIHGHPTPSQRMNRAIGAIPLALWLPYPIYRRSHIAHHDSLSITDPAIDPESRYVRKARTIAWLAAKAQSTLAGRLVLGPPIAIATLLLQEVERLRDQPMIVLRDWVPHLVGVALIIAWLRHVEFDLAAYLLLFVYPGMALTALRSFAEHRALPSQTGRAATVERGGLFALLFLNNNLHAAHHDRPGLAWYKLPSYHRQNRHRLIGNGLLLYTGYAEIVRRYAVQAHDAVIHPDYRMLVE